MTRFYTAARPCGVADPRVAVVAAAVEATIS